MECKIDSTGRPAYRRHNDFGLLNSFEDVKSMAPKIVDFGSAMRLEKEATLGCGWDHSSDIWMLGILTWNFIERMELFEHYIPNDTYCARYHLAEMIALPGPPPEELIETSDRMIVKEFPLAVRHRRTSCA
ncbi:hypothetical protein SI65_01645 [Aspergillus cristatus]|uniref:Protein kinase domain-containing protein n=1 Tax=Aspergillus cristatus TaxID=573508 RepID=A0A1E3BSZ3_ASPCR|nr:hypothetical protein SI65_01645 [Aspergillus cristatus]